MLVIKYYWEVFPIYDLLAMIVSCVYMDSVSGRRRDRFRIVMCIGRYDPPISSRQTENFALRQNH